MENLFFRKPSLGTLLFLAVGIVQAATIRIDTDQVVRTIDRSHILGQNMALWYSPSILTNSQTLEYLRDAGIGGIRIPGGSWGDKYFWNGNGVRNGFQVDPSKYHDYQWDIDFSDWAPGFAAELIPGKPDTPKLVGQVPLSIKDLHEFNRRMGCETMAIVNAGTGNARLAEEWVRWANRKQDYKVRYWEVGNELEGSWEQGNTRPDGSKMDGVKYARIYSEFARAMRRADPSIKVGGPTSTDPRYSPIPTFLREITEPLDFLSFHVYARNQEETIAGWAREAQRISSISEDLRGFLREYRPDRADEIEIHLTEINIWPTGAPTVKMDIAVWSCVAIGEMLRSQVDRCWFWDAFTVSPKTGQGHGFLFPTPEGIVRKPQYWAFYIFHHYFGNHILQTETDAPDLYAYASTNEQGQLCAIVVNASEEPVSAGLNLRGSGATRYRRATCALFSEMECKWNFEKNRPWWSGPPRKRECTLRELSDHTFPPVSITAFTLSPGDAGPAILVPSGDDLRFPPGIQANLAVQVLDGNGRPAARVPVVARSLAHAVKTSRKVAQTDSNGVARIAFSTARKPVKGELRIAARLPSGKVVERVCPAQTMNPSLEVVCPDSVEIGAPLPLLFLLHAGIDKETGQRRLLDCPAKISLRGNGNSASIEMVNGVASAKWTAPRKPGKMRISASILPLHLSARRDVEVCPAREETACMLAFNGKGDLEPIDEAARERAAIDDSIRPNQGVLAYLPAGSDDRISFRTDRFPNQNRLREIRGKTTGASIDVMLPRGTRLPLGASLEWEIRSGSEVFRKKVPLNSLKQGKWATLQVEIPQGRLDSFTRVDRISLAFHRVKPGGKIYIDQLSLRYRNR